MNALLDRSLENAEATWAVGNLYTWATWATLVEVPNLRPPAISPPKLSARTPRLIGPGPDPAHGYSHRSRAGVRTHLVASNARSLQLQVG